MSAQPEGAGSVAIQAMFSRLGTAERRLTVLTGAGVSTESGVPDFRSPGSPWRVHTPIGFQDFITDPERRAEAWRRKFAMDDIYRNAKPGRSHLALAALAARGVIRSVVTQNIDGLHQAAGLDPDCLVELHGNGTFARCLSCRSRVELDEARRVLNTTGKGPICDCGGIVKSATIAFGQSLDPEVIEAAIDAAVACDVFLAIGSSLVVRPAARLPLLAKETGATLVIVNDEATPLDPAADFSVRGDTGAFLSELACWH